MTRAREPDDRGVVDRGGVRIAWEQFGAGHPTIVLVPTWSIVDSRVWKLQVADFARRWRVITFDPRGNGSSDRPASADAYAEAEFAADILAVMDATRTPTAVLVSLSMGAQRSLLVAAEHPARVAGVVFIGPALPLGRRVADRAAIDFETPDGADVGWGRYNRHSWHRDYAGFLAFFFGQAVNELHSTKPIEDAVGWGLQTDPATLVLTEEAPRLAGRAEVLELAARVRCPVLVIQGDGDRIRPPADGAELAVLTGGRLVTIAGGGHMPLARDPVPVNLLIRDFVRSLPRRAAEFEAAGGVPHGPTRRTRAAAAVPPIRSGDASPVA